MVERVTICGATGSIGRSTLDVIARHPERYELFAATAHTSVTRMLGICQEFQPKIAVMTDSDSAAELRQKLADMECRTEVYQGEKGLIDAVSASEVDIVMAAIVGAAGLVPTFSAVKAGKKVLLANKEALVMSGRLLMNEVRASGATLLPIDSEHNAIFQCLPAEGQAGQQVEKVVLTASGGPFRNSSAESLQTVTPQQAVAHPNWSMGPKISVDSATLMNKGLEFIEACLLFSLSVDRVDVVIHPESIVHSMVQYIDGSVLAQMGNPDMRTPIAYGLAWPERIDAGVAQLDLVAAGRLTFFEPDPVRFPCLLLAMQAAKAGGVAPTCLNAANEVAVAAFLAGQIGFTDISVVAGAVMQQLINHEPDSLEAVQHADHEAREQAKSHIAAYL